MTITTNASAGTTLHLPSRDEAFANVARATRLDAIHLACTRPELFVDRETYGQFSDTLARHRAKAVEAVLRHREDALASQALTS